MSFKCLYLITIIVAVVNETTIATIMTTTATETGILMTSSVSPTEEGRFGGGAGKK